MYISWLLTTAKLITFFGCHRLPSYLYLLAAYNRQATYIPWLSIAISLAVNRRQGNTNQQQKNISK